MTEPEVKAKYKQCSEVTPEECFIGGNHCATCMHCFGEHRWSAEGEFNSVYCTCAKKEET